MKQRLSNWISNNWPVLFLVLLEIVLAWKNIIPGSWLTGWDSTQPELNLNLNLVRSLTSIWQEYRGLGLPDGMAHAANIVHLFYVWILSLVVSDNLVRYVFVFLSHLVGGIGVYKLFQHLLKKSNWLALAGAIFYLLNPITIQMFYQPLELFIIHFAGLPWLVLTLMKYLEDGGRRNLAWIAIVLIAFISQNHVPTIFVVTMMAMGITLLVSLIGSRGRSFKKIMAVIGLVLGVNSFWLLPYTVTTVSNSQIIPQAKMNLLSNPEVILRNAEYGDLSRVVRMQGFSLSYEDWHLHGPTGLQMPQWASWWDARSVEVMMWVVFGLVLLGIIKSVWKRNWKLISIGLIWIMALLNLGVRIPLIDQLMTWVYANVPFYAAVFRFAFTKFSIIFTFTSTILMIYTLDGLVKKWGKMIFGIILIGASLWIAFPAFNGNLLYKELRINLPSEYQKLFSYFDKAEVGRVARFPAFDLWGWESNNWGYRGSGVVWQGSRSPMLLRSFDPWSPYNETFYDQLSTALYGGNKDEVEKVLSQYDVKYVLLDESIIAPGQDKEILRIEETKNMARELGWNEKFHEGFLTVWETGFGADKFVSAPASYSFVGADTMKTRKDVAYGDVGTYVTSKSNEQLSEPVIVYPFASLMKEEVLGVEYGENKITLSSDQLPIVAQGSELLIPGWKVGDIVRIDYQAGSPVPAYKINGVDGPRFLGKEKPLDGKSYIVAKVGEGKEWSEYLADKEFVIQGGKISVEILGDPSIYDFAKQGNAAVKNCDVLSRGTVVKEGSKYVADQRGSVCDYVVMSDLDTRLDYFMRLQGENVEGRSVKFFLYNTGSKRNDLEYLLSKGKFDQTFALLPWSWDGFYTLNIDVRSFGEKTINTINPVEIRHVPVDKLARAKIVNEASKSLNKLEITKVKKVGTWLYIVETKNAGLLRLSQGYDEGWVSPWLQHVKVDGWANGWMVPGSVTIVIFYWPQLLEYLGFGLLGAMVLILFFHKK